VPYKIMRPIINFFLPQALRESLMRDPGMSAEEVKDLMGPSTGTFNINKNILDFFDRHGGNETVYTPHIFDGGFYRRTDNWVITLAKERGKKSTIPVFEW
jgi:hypothetical protein